MQSSSFLFYFLSILIGLPHVYSIIEGVSPINIVNKTIQIWPQKYSGNTVDFDPIIGELVDTTDTNKTGKIVLIRDCKRPYEPKFRTLIFEGAKAILCSLAGRPSDVPGNEMYAIDGSDRSSLTVPIATVVTKDIEEIFSANGTIIIRVITEPNEFMQVYESMWLWLWQVSLTCVIFGNIVFASYRLLQLLSFYRRFKISIGVVSVVICLTSSLFMFLGLSIDPFGSRQIMPWWMRNFLFSLPLPFVIAPLFLMALWWHSLLVSLKFQVHPGLPKFKWVVYIWIFILLFQQTMFGILTSLKLLPRIVFVLSTPTITFISFVAVLVYCIVTLYLLRKRVKKVKLQSKEQRIQLRRIRFSLSAVSVSLAVMIALFLCFLADISFPVIEVVYYWFLWLGMAALVTIELYVLKPPRRPIKTKAMPSSSSKTKSTAMRRPTIVDVHMQKGKGISTTFDSSEAPSVMGDTVIDLTKTTKGNL